jgi:hypothetical protein
MNLQLQFLREDIRKQNEQASRKKSSAEAQIIIGNILLFISAVVILVLAIFSAYSPGLVGNSILITILGCCFGSGIALHGMAGILLFLVGMYRRYTAEQELNAAEDASRRLMQLVTEDDMQRLNPVQKP